MGPRPHVWKSGPDEFRHDMYTPWMRSRAQATFRNEGWDLTFEEYYDLWKDDWHNRGRKPDDVCMTRRDPDLSWSKDNCYIITRKEHLAEQGRARVGMKYRMHHGKRGPDKQPRKRPNNLIYTKAPK